MDNILEKNSSFHVKYCTTRKVQLLFSRSLLLVVGILEFDIEDLKYRISKLEQRDSEK